MGHKSNQEKISSIFLFFSLNWHSSTYQLTLLSYRHVHAPCHVPSCGPWVSSNYAFDWAAAGPSQRRCKEFPSVGLRSCQPCRLDQIADALWAQMTRLWCHVHRWEICVNEEIIIKLSAHSAANLNYLSPVLSALFIAIISVGCCRCGSRHCRWILHRCFLHATNAGHFSLFALHLEPLLTRVDQRRWLTLIVLRTIFATITRSMTTMFPMRSTWASGAARHLTLVVGDALWAWTMTSSWTWVIRRLTLDRTWPLPVAGGERAICIADGGGVFAWWSRSHWLGTRRDAEESALLTLGPSGTSCAAGRVGRRVSMAWGFAVLLDGVVVVEVGWNAVGRTIQAVETGENFWC